MAPIFFLSYAREDGKHPALGEFYKQLLEAVRRRVGGASEGKGFMDASDIALGGEWPDALGQALQGCEVFVPVYSATYFTKEYCGKEWAVFRERQDRYAAARNLATRPPLVIPVLWGAKEDLPRSVPEDLLDLQFTTSAFADVYAHVGLDVLMRQSKYENERIEAIEAIARRIKLAREAHQLPPLPTPPAIKKVPALFPVPAPVVPPTAAGGGAAGQDAVSAEGGPRFVQIVLVAGARDEFATARQTYDFYGADGLEWRPYRPKEERRVGALAMQIAAERDFLPGPPVSLDESLVAQLKAAEQQNRIVVLLVDTWTLRIERYRTLMQTFDQINYRNAAVLVLWDGAEETATSAETLDEMVRVAFEHRSQNRESRVFISPVKSVDDFRRDLGEALEAARRRMREHAALLRNVVYRPRPTF